MKGPKDGTTTRVILCRFGELFLKSGNRKRFEATLHRNMAAAVADVPGARVEPVHGRVLVHVPDELAAEDAAQRLERVFGLVSISVASVTAPTLDAMSAEACAASGGAAAGACPLAASGVRAIVIERMKTQYFCFIEFPSFNTPAEKRCGRWP